jgi:carbamoyl-phosphate synthase large subunit
MKRVAILSAGSPGSIAVIRVLKANNYAVHGIDIDARTPAQNLVDSFELKADLEQRGIERLQDFDFVLSSTVEEFDLIERSGAKHLQPPASSYELCRDKFVTASVALSGGINHPKTSASWPGNNFSGYVVKPRFGRGSKGLYITNKPVGAFSHFAESDEPMIIQNLIAGREFNVDGIAKSGNGIGWFCHYSDLMRGGITTKAETFNNPRVNDLVKLICEKFKLHGLFNIGGILDENGKPWLIEINPRLSPGIIIGHLAGARPITAWENFVSGRSISSADYSIKTGVVVSRYFEETIIK